MHMLASTTSITQQLLTPKKVTATSSSHFDSYLNQITSFCERIFLLPRKAARSKPYTVFLFLVHYQEGRLCRSDEVPSFTCVAPSLSVCLHKSNLANGPSAEDRQGNKYFPLCFWPSKPCRCSANMGKIIQSCLLSH